MIMSFPLFTAPQLRSSGMRKLRVSEVFPLCSRHTGLARGPEVWDVVPSTLAASPTSMRFCAHLTPVPGQKFPLQGGGPGPLSKRAASPPPSLALSLPLLTFVTASHGTVLGLRGTSS